MSPADFNLIKDGQTQWLIDKITSLSKTKTCISILDYGCGKMRLYNALSELNFRFNYVGTDFESSEEINTIINTNDNCNFISLSEIAGMGRNSFDIVCLSNVVHEISIIEFAEIILTTKLLLMKDGHFLLLDMSVLPQGELLGLPYFPDEVLSLFEPMDYAFETQSGYPIIACDICPSALMLPHVAIEKLYSLVMKKRDDFSFLALSLVNKYGIDFFNEKFKNINKRMNSEELLGYAQYLSGLSNYRMVEFRQSYYSDNDNEFYIDLINLYMSTFDRTGEQLSLIEMYDKLYPKYSVTQITCKLKQATYPHSFFGFDDGERLYATERLDYFLNNYTFDDLRKSGIIISAMCGIED